MTPYGVICLGHQYYRWRPISYSVPIRYLNQCWLFDDCVLRYTFSAIWNFKIFIQENAFEYVVCEIAAIFPGPNLAITMHISQYWGIGAFSNTYALVDESSLVQLTSCRLHSVKSLPERILAHSRLIIGDILMWNVNKMWNVILTKFVDEKW